ncbi:S-adenosyl-L-methionine-dependent methyltransferase [Podospora aff. communis PSN243]|uniref:S-adenosyl-L-methionine-dependent methyltransferase n=1 Tax=Podospora aff. communis PSN243 TaxID=3040156 RepID=A0AAV9GSW2_9PEZI|nr:S-adenosyl-L-methionine-dependent methyltransferase [Podospora aff. communis PSN243]
MHAVPHCSVKHVVVGSRKKPARIYPLNLETPQAAQIRVTQKSLSLTFGFTEIPGQSPTQTRPHNRYRTSIIPVGTYLIHCKVNMAGDESKQRSSPPRLPPTANQPPALAHELDDDVDSALGEDQSDSTASITSSIVQYRTLHGRTYHSERGNALYWGSNDERQSKALDINHHAQTLAIGGKLYLAPLKKDKVKNVLDIGTGTGIWAIDFADEFPDANIIGTDISPIQPTWVPPNVRFEIEDCCQPWTFPDNDFDFVHMRGLVGSIDDWNALLKRAYDSLKPGGWLQSFEPSVVWETDDGTLPKDSALYQWGPIFTEWGAKSGRSFTVLEDGLQRKAMESAGFVDIDEFNTKQPIGKWPADEALRERGEFVRVWLEQDAEGIVLFIMGAMGWTREDVMVFLAKFRREVRSGKYRPYFRNKIIWGKKPEA